MPPVDSKKKKKKTKKQIAEEKRLAELGLIVYF
jgi:hypothetical protein